MGRGKKKPRGAGYSMDEERPIAEGEWQSFELTRDVPSDNNRRTPPEETDEGQAVPENYEQSISGGEGGLGEDTESMSEGPEQTEPAARFDYPGEDSGFETHSRLGDEEGFTPFSSENWNRQEYQAFSQSGPSENIELPAEGVPTVHRDGFSLGQGSPAYSYTNPDASPEEERFYSDDEAIPPPKSYGIASRSDEEIYREIYERLAEEPDIEEEDIQIEVAEGSVTLRGSVDSRLEKFLIQDIVDDVDGVRDIHDELSLAAE